MSRGARAAEQPAGDDDRQPVDAEPVELVRGRGDREMPRAERRCGDRQRRLLDHERRGAAARDELLERLAGEREAQRVAHRLRHVVEHLALGRRPEDDVVRARLGDDDPRVREQRDARHVLRCAAAAVTPSATKMPPDETAEPALPRSLRAERPASRSREQRVAGSPTRTRSPRT